MGCYGYCIVPAGVEPPAQLRGIAGVPVVARSVGALVVWASELDRPAASVEHAVAHNAVVEAAVTSEVTPVPLRFGQWAESAADFDRAIAGRADWYHERLRHFAGALEFGLRVIKTGPAPAQVVHAADATGLEYMKALRDRAAAAQAERADADRVHASIGAILGEFVREEKVEHARTPRGLISVAHLVARTHFDAYRAHAATLTSHFPELKFLVSGPWAPYSFAA